MPAKNQFKKIHTCHETFLSTSYKNMVVTDIHLVGAPLACRSEYSGGIRIAPRKGHVDVIVLDDDGDSHRIHLASDQLLEQLHKDGAINYPGATFGAMEYAMAIGLTFSPRLLEAIFRDGTYKLNAEKGRIEKCGDSLTTEKIS